MSIDLQKFQEEHGTLLVWALALGCVTFLVYTDKVPASTIEYLLAWAAGQAFSRRGGAPTVKKLPGAVGPEGPGVRT